MGKRRKRQRDTRKVVSGMVLDAHPARYGFSRAIEAIWPTRCARCRYTIEPGEPMRRQLFAGIAGGWEHEHCPC